MVKGLNNVGTFMEIVGVNDLDVPVEGYLGVPVEGYLDVLITIFGPTMMASFFVKPVASNSTVGRRNDYLVILGCNVLRLIAESSTAKVGPSKDNWQLALCWMQIVAVVEVCADRTPAVDALTAASSSGDPE